MARNRLEAQIEDSAIADLAEYANEHHSGDLNAALEEMIAMIAKATVPVTGGKPQSKLAEEPTV